METGPVGSARPRSTSGMFTALSSLLFARGLFSVSVMESGYRVSFLPVVPSFIRHGAPRLFPRNINGIRTRAAAEQLAMNSTSLIGRNPQGALKRKNPGTLSRMPGCQRPVSIGLIRDRRYPVGI